MYAYEVWFFLGVFFRPLTKKNKQANCLVECKKDAIQLEGPDRGWGLAVLQWTEHRWSTFKGPCFCFLLNATSCTPVETLRWLIGNWTETYEPELSICIKLLLVFETWKGFLPVSCPKSHLASKKKVRLEPWHQRFSDSNGDVVQKKEVPAAKQTVSGKKSSHVLLWVANLASMPQSSLKWIGALQVPYVTEPV